MTYSLLLIILEFYYYDGARRIQQKNISMSKLAWIAKLRCWSTEHKWYGVYRYLPVG